MMNMRRMMKPPVLRLRDGGDLRTGHGGNVPGAGTGDKIDAKYEPGEFVASNAMLDAAPGLREGLHSLRSNVLASQGKTVAQADAKALSSGSLRADAGGSWYDDSPLPTGMSNGQNQTGVAGASPGNQGSGVLSGAVPPGVDGGGNRSGQPQPARVGYVDSLRTGLPGVAAVASGTYDDVSSSLGKGQYAGAAIKGLRGGVAAIPAVLNDTVGAGIRGAYDMLKNPAEDAGRAALGMDDRKPANPAATTPPIASPATAAQPPQYNTPGQDATMPGQDPGQDPNRVTLRGQAGTDVGGAPGVSKFVQNGKTLYSNVAGPDNDKLMSNNPGVSVVPGMSRAEIDRTMTNPDGSRWSAGDNAIMSANLRDGVDPYRGTSRGSAGNDLMSRIAQQGPNHAIASLLANQQNTTALRAQDVQREVAMAPAKLAAQQRSISAEIFARAGNDNEKAAQIAEQMGYGNTLAKDFRAAKSDQIKNTGEVANQGTAAIAARSKAQQDTHTEIAGMLPATAEGKPDLDTAARYSTALNADLSAKEAQLTTDVKAGKPGAAAALADLQKNGHGALGEGYKQRFVVGMQAKEAQAANASGAWNLRGGTGATFNGPVGSMSDDKNGFLGFGRTYSNYDSNGRKVGTTPARVVEKDGSLFGGVDNHTYDNLITQPRK